MRGFLVLALTTAMLGCGSSDEKNNAGSEGVEVNADTGAPDGDGTESEDTGPQEPDDDEDTGSSEPDT